MVLLRPAALVRSYEARPANTEGRGQVSMGDLLQQSLRDSPDVIVVGETRGEDGVHLLDAASNGRRRGDVHHPRRVPRGGCSTGSCRWSARPTRRYRRTIALMAATSLDVIVHVARNRDHQRFVTEVVEVAHRAAGRERVPGAPSSCSGPRRTGGRCPPGANPTPPGGRLVGVGFDLDWLTPGAATWDQDTTAASADPASRGRAGVTLMIARVRG